MSLIKCELIVLKVPIFGFIEIDNNLTIREFGGQLHLVDLLQDISEKNDALYAGIGTTDMMEINQVNVIRGSLDAFLVSRTILHPRRQCFSVHRSAKYHPIDLRKAWPEDQ